MQRLLNLYRGSPGGHSWYANARAIARTLARRFGVSEACACGVIAALSPRMHWGRNIVAASEVLAAAVSGQSGPPRVGMRRFVALAWLIALGARPLDVLGGPKVRSFYRNLRGDLSTVTVDVWALRALGMSGDKSLSHAQYERVAATYRRAAAKVGVEPAVFQAVVWTAVRGREG